MLTTKLRTITATEHSTNNNKQEHITRMWWDRRNFKLFPPFSNFSPFFLSLPSTVHPLVQVPNQLVGAPVGRDVTLICNVEASPKAINYWQRENSEYLYITLFITWFLEGSFYNLRFLGVSLKDLWLFLLLNVVTDRSILHTRWTVNRNQLTLLTLLWVLMNFGGNYLSLSKDVTAVFESSTISPKSSNTSITPKIHKNPSQYIPKKIVLNIPLKIVNCSLHIHFFTNLN